MANRFLGIYYTVEVNQPAGTDQPAEIDQPAETNQPADPNQPAGRNQPAKWVSRLTKNVSRLISQPAEPAAAG